MRRLRLLLERAPRSSEYHRERVGPKATWTDHEYLLANIADGINQLSWLTSMAHRDPKKAPPERPKPIPRPGDAAKRQARRTQLSGREIARRLVDLARSEKKRRG